MTDKYPWIENWIDAIALGIMGIMFGCTMYVLFYVVL